MMKVVKDFFATDVGHDMDRWRPELSGNLI